MLAGLLFLTMGFDNTRHFKGGSTTVADSTEQLVTPTTVPVWQYYVYAPPAADTYTFVVYTNSTYTDSITMLFYPGSVSSLQTPVFGIRAYRFRVLTPNVANATLTVVWEN
jgi:hypothetical protein